MIRTLKDNSFRLLLLLVCLGLSACPKPLLEDLDQLEENLTGSFTSSDQASRDSSYFDIRLESVPIWTDREDGPWLYVEQASADALEKPYRQRVYHLSLTDSLLISTIYSIPSPLRFAGHWKEEFPLQELIPDSLNLRKGCEVYLTRTGKEDFEGQTKLGSCSSSLRGASYATSEVKLDKWAIHSWDRGFDSADKQVWGAVEGPYHFEKKWPD